MMRKRLGALIGLSGLAAATMSATCFSGSATAAGMQLTVGRPDLTAKILVEVPATVVCDSLDGAQTLADSVTVSLKQASGSSINTGSGHVAGGPFSVFGGVPFLTCDGTTVNTVVVSVVPDAGSGPFHGGPAIITVDAAHSVGTCTFPGFCQSTGSESAHIGPTSIKITG
jgi:hypothetical protein